ncbi:diadenylate cyclase [Mycoplasmopsis pulmonis]|nr:diadenylate cyclase [Mycoplasmopsis pulmonis]MDZ7293349.1 diadenylate cyclase [Mycoplasmopsis pulmonis]VEU68161.1 membrane protein [Mycoplasmopsis pulmonis]
MNVVVIVIMFVLLTLILFFASFNHISALLKFIFKKSRYSKMGNSSKIRLIHQVKEAVEQLAKTKTGAIITIENKDQIDNLRTDGIILDANISSSLIISLFNKESPLHDGAIIIRDNKILYAATYYKITKKSMDNKYGARHRAAMGISELSDATTIIVSEETGEITIAKNSYFNSVSIKDFQENLVKFLKD